MDLKSLVIYDSKYGNTERIAQEIGRSTGARVLQAGEVDLTELRSCSLLFLGPPTHGGWYSEAIQGLIKASPAMEGVPTAVFDTRTKSSLFGFAAPRLARALEKGGGKLASPPEGFIVLGMQGPLKDGELERTGEWARSIEQVAG